MHCIVKFDLFSFLVIEFVTVENGLSNFAFEIKKSFFLMKERQNKL